MIDSPAATPEMLLRSVLRGLRQEAEGAGADDLARRAALLDERLRSRRLLVAVIGEHNRGKSTLINSLIGSSWLPVGQHAPTLPPVYVYGAAQEHVELVYEDGSAAESTQAELLSLTPEDAAGVSHARVGLPGADLYGLVLVDTPGLNDPDTSRLMQTVYDVLPHSDLVLLVLDSAQALGASEHALVEHRVLRTDLHQLVVVLNRDDELEDEAQRAAVRERVSRILRPLVGDEPTILPYAARTALRARERDDQRLLSRSGYPELSALLQASAAERVHILQGLVAARAGVLGVEMRARLAAERTVAVPDAVVSELPARMEIARRTVATIADEHVLDVRAFSLELHDRLPDEVGESTPEDIRRFLPFYIQQQFAAFLREREESLVERVRGALTAAGLDDLPVPPDLLGRPLAPGLHPYVAPDFLEDSIVITTFMQVIGLAVPSVLTTALMTLGPLLRRFTRGMQLQDERGALLRAAQAATLEAGAALERQMAVSVARLAEMLRVEAQPPAEITSMEAEQVDPAAVARVDLLLQALSDLVPAALPEHLGRDGALRRIG